MSRETLAWLNANTLIGMTDKRGTAWHYRAADQGDEANHYSGAIPLEDVRRRLFNWHAVETPLYVRNPDGFFHELADRKAIVRSDTFATLGTPSARYVPHQYDEWLLGNVASLLDDDLIIGSAGLLRGGAVAWVQVEMPENFKAGDVEFRPNLLATTSFDSSIATTYKRTATVVVCDNTRELALHEASPTVAIRHTASSMNRLGDARQALGIIFEMATAFQDEVNAMLSQYVSDNTFTGLVQQLVPIAADDSKHKVTRATNLRETYEQMWRNDPRCNPWKNTGFGVMQVVNTYRQHVRPTRGGTVSVERTMMETLMGTTGLEDGKVASLLALV